MDVLNQYLPTVLIFLGLAMLAIEVGVLGFSVMVLFFIGVGCLATGLLMLVNVIPETMVGALAGSGVMSLVAAVGLWKPLKRLQDKSEHKQVTSDLIGHRFTLDSNVSSEQPGQVSFSGVTWQVSSDTPISSGTKVEIIRINVGKLTVAPTS